MSDRAPYNGRPFYCKACGLGFGEYMACEEPDCELESEADAQARRERHLAKPPTDDEIAMADDLATFARQVMRALALNPRTAETIWRLGDTIDRVREGPKISVRPDEVAKLVIRQLEDFNTELDGSDTEILKHAALNAVTLIAEASCHDPASRPRTLQKARRFRDSARYIEDGP